MACNRPPDLPSVHRPAYRGRHHLFLSRPRVDTHHARHLIFFCPSVDVLLLLRRSASRRRFLTFFESCPRIVPLFVGVLQRTRPLPSPAFVVFFISSVGKTRSLRLRFHAPLRFNLCRAFFLGCSSSACVTFFSKVLIQHFTFSTTCCLSQACSYQRAASFRRCPHFNPSRPIPSRPDPSDHALPRPAPLTQQLVKRRRFDNMLSTFPSSCANTQTRCRRHHIPRVWSRPCTVSLRRPSALHPASRRRIRHSPVLVPTDVYPPFCLSLESFTFFLLMMIACVDSRSD